VREDSDTGLAIQLASEQLWSELDDAWQEAFRRAWEALRTGNIPIGACASEPGGTIVHAARNRVTDQHGPAGEVFGSALAHAEINVLARLPFRQPRQLILTSTLEPCIQCSAAIRLGPVAVVRFAGADPLWDGCHDFSPLSPREAARPKMTIDGPRADEIGVFGRLISRLGPDLGHNVEPYLRAAGQAGTLDLARELQHGGEVPGIADMEVHEAFDYLWPRLTVLRGAESSPTVMAASRRDASPEPSPQAT
jgi:tRNA(Arg) A34 adenosine deaminase TadA